MRDSERYMAQADAVLRMATRAASGAERQIYESIAEGWRKLALEAGRNERHDISPAAGQPAPEAGG